MKILNFAITPICPECRKVMCCSDISSNTENRDITIWCENINCINEDIEYIYTIPEIEVFEKQGE